MTHELNLFPNGPNHPKSNAGTCRCSTVALIDKTSQSSIHHSIQHTQSTNSFMRTPNNHLFSLQKISRSAKRAILVLCLYIATAFSVSAQQYDGGGFGLQNVGYDEYGGFIEFVLPMGSNVDNNAFNIHQIRLVKGGRVLMRYNDANNNPVEQKVVDFEGVLINGKVQSRYKADKCFISRAKGEKYRNSSGQLVLSPWDNNVYLSSTVNPTWHGPYYDEADNHNFTGRWDGATQTLVIRWYLLPEYIGKQLSFRLLSDGDEIRDRYGNYSSFNGGYRIDCAAENGVQTVPDVLKGSGKAATLSSGVSAIAGKMKVDYSYTATLGATVDTNNHISHWVSALPGGASVATDTARDATNNNARGSVNIDKSNDARTVRFNTKFVGKGGYCVYTRTDEQVKIDAYQWPTLITPTYNASTGIVLLEWSINKLTDLTYIKGDAFEVQRSVDPAYPGPSTKTFSINFDAGVLKNGLLTYAISDDLKPENPQGMVYYRLRRTKSSADWEWNTNVNTKREVFMQVLGVAANANLPIVLDTTTSSPNITLHWNINEGVWPSGSRFVIRRKEDNGTTTTVSDIASLTDAELKLKKYVDNNINTCITYSYSLQVMPGGNVYPTQAEVKLPGTAILGNMGSIRNLRASKGYFPDRVELQWYSEGAFTQYALYRSATGSFANAVQLATIPSVSTVGGTLQYVDTRAVAGTYYTYFIEGVSQCGGNASKTPQLKDIGFRSPTGNIYGRITYENGQAVENVAVSLQNNNGTLPSRSIVLTGKPESYLQIDSLTTPFATDAFSIEAWIKPVDSIPMNQVVFSKEGQYEAGFDAAGQLYFTANGNTVSGGYVNKNKSFVHIAGVSKSDSIWLYLNDSLIASGANTNTANPTISNTVFIGKSASGNNFKGNVDEMRAWNKSLTAGDIAKNYTRNLVGNEAGLAAYWHFDETIADQFFDLSQQGETFNRNDGYMDSSAVKHTLDVPTPSQLALKGITDQSGNYMISGIPYTDNGTTYTILPTLGTHVFDPVSVNRLLSASSSQFTVDFKDKSSFSVSGTIYYRNSTIPVKGVQFKIDGQYAHLQNGDIIETNDAGQFTIYVPVGTHEVRAVKLNHGFENGGLFTDSRGQNLNYQGPISERILFDTTTIRFIGRVAGGAVQEAFPLGHSLSKNNLGENLSLSMELVGDRNRKINASGTDDTVRVNHLLPANQTAQRKTNVTYKEYSINIQPDSITGEFVADLIPENYIITSVKATGYDDFIGSNPVSINLSDKFNKEKEINNYRDSVNTGGNNWTYHSYSDTVFYNDKYKFIYREKPSIALQQLNGKGEALEYLGEDSVRTTLFNGNTLTVDVFNNTNTTYLFGYPVFVQKIPYTVKVTAFEEYKYYKENNTSPVSIQKVGTTDGLVSIVNNLRDGANGVDTFSLNDKGEAIYKFYAGTPEMGNGIGRKGFSMSIKFGSQVLQWRNGATQEAYILGGRKTGTDFVTSGPDEVLTVLRDPGGSNSFSYYEKGTTITKQSSTSNGLSQSGDVSLEWLWGTEISTSSGVGFEVTTKVDVINTTGVQLTNEETVNWDNSTTSVATLLSSIRTSADPQYVGAGGDLFFGNSTNISYGATLNLVVVKNTEVSASDVIFYDGAANGVNFSIVQRSGIDASQRFGTTFLYPAKHIEEILIPNLIKGRNSFLLPKGTSDVDAQQRADNLKQIVYVSKLTGSDPNFGKSNRDVNAFGQGVKLEAWDNGSSYKIFFPRPEGTVIETDTILSMNQSIDSWKKALADNEQEKLEAKELVNNYSFTGGSSIDYSAQTNTSTTKSYSKNFAIGASLLKQNGFKISETGFIFKINESISYLRTEATTNDNTESSKFGFRLQETDMDYLSVDVLKAADKSFVFRTKGGVTKCPYEGATKTKYYQPGTIIDQPTMQAEVPAISVEQPVVTNIPSSRKASYVVKLFNASDIKNGATFKIRVGDNSNPNGAKVYMDGTELGTGREISVPSGDALTKTITLERGPSAMDYENIQVILESSCESDIADTVMISAHFIPSCSDIHIKSPVDKWVLNTASPVNSKGDYYLPITIDQFDVNNSKFDHIALQYKPSSSSIWITVMKFYSDTAKLKAAEGEKLKIVGNGVINYNLVMSAVSMSDQNYDVRALSYCMENGQTIATTESNLVAGIKDTYNPRLFGNPQPANGILGVEDDVRINFNETIADGLLSPADFQVTGIRNGVPTDHNVSVKLDGQNDFIATEFAKNLSAKNITVELWALPNASANGTLFSQGVKGQSLEMALTSSNYLELTVGSKLIKSDAPVVFKNGEWSHLALVLNATTNKVSAYYNFAEVIHGVTVEPYTGAGVVQIGKSIKDDGNYFAGKVHGLRLWTDALSSITLQENSLKQLSGGENGLLAYYPMTEGKGAVVADVARGVNAKLLGNWSMPQGRALAMSGSGYLKLNTAFAPVTKAMDYTLELWFKAAPGQTNATLLSSGKGDGTDVFGSADLFSLGFENGLMTFRNNASLVNVEGNYLDNNWHHFALSVNRNVGNAQVHVDGLLKKTFDPKDLGGIASASVLVGARTSIDPVDFTTTKVDQYFKGNVDEIRIWNTYLNQSILAQNNNTALKGDELGLMAYYPFEKYVSFQNNQDLVYTLSDRKTQEVPNTIVPDAVAVSAAESMETAPVKRRGAVEPLQFDYVVNNDALIINLKEPKAAIDKTIVTFKVKNVRDKNGNPILSPITWSAYIDRNPLKWSDDELNLSKAVDAEMQFEAQIVNNGGSLQNFRLTNVPAWLHASPNTGTLSPKGSQKIVFTVNKGINVGAYDEVIYMINDNNESEPLAINLKVRGPKPNWTVNPADYKYNMSVYGQIRVQGVFSKNPEDMLAAFVNGKCVGVTNSSYFTNTDSWFSLLTVYSDSLRHNKLEFRIWDAATGKTYLSSPSPAIGFVNDTIFGTARYPIIFDGYEQQFQNVKLNKGWNWISFALTDNRYDSVATKLINGQWNAGDIVKNEETGFSQYSSNSGWSGTLPRFNNLSMFNLRTENEQTLSTQGVKADVAKTRIPVKAGRWNYISYLPMVNVSVKEALADYSAADGDVIKSQTGFAMYDTRNGWVGNLSYLEPGKGYMLLRKGVNDVSFVYPVISGILSGKNVQKADNPNPVQIPVEGNFAYADNMTLVAVAEESFALQQDDKLLVYAGAELRGEAMTMLNPLTGKRSYFLNVSGSGNDMLHFELSRRGSIVGVADQPMAYQTNNSIGTLVNPYVLRFSKVSGAEADKVYPVPFKNNVHVRLNLNTIAGQAEHVIKMSVYDVSGKLVYAGAAIRTSASYYELIWSGRSNNGSVCQSGIYMITALVDGKQRVFKVTKD